MKQRFFKCNLCGNIVASVYDSGVPIVCCGQEMQEIIPGSVDASLEKHVPVYAVSNGKVHVRIGAEAHPMTPEHYIEWISIQTDKGNQRKTLKPGDTPDACFMLCEDENIEAVYAYCNLHGLWVK